MPLTWEAGRRDSTRFGVWLSHVTPAGIVTILLLGIWLALVVFTASRHEFWRDEVRALSIARAASSPIDLYRLVQYAFDAEAGDEDDRVYALEP